MSNELNLYAPNGKKITSQAFLEETHKSVLFYRPGHPTTDETDNVTLDGQEVAVARSLYGHLVNTTFPTRPTDGKDVQWVDENGGLWTDDEVSWAKALQAYVVEVRETQGGRAWRRSDVHVNASSADNAEKRAQALLKTQNFKDLMIWSEWIHEPEPQRFEVIGAVRAEEIPVQLER